MSHARRHEIVGPLLVEHFLRALNCLSQQLAKVGLRAFFVEYSDGLGQVLPPVWSNLGNLNHIRAGSDLLPIWILFRCQSTQVFVRQPVLSDVAGVDDSRYAGAEQQ